MLKKCLIFWAVLIYLNLFKWCRLNVTQPSLINNRDSLQLVVSLWQHIQDLTSDWPIPSPRTFSNWEVLFKPSPKHLQIPRWSVQTQPKWLPSDVRKPVMFRNYSKDSTINCCCTSITVYSEVFGLRVRQPRSPATKQRHLCLTEITNCPYE